LKPRLCAGGRAESRSRGAEDSFGSGFGKATAAHFLARDWNVIVTMRSPKSGLFENSDQLLVTSLDLISSESISNAISKGIDRFGKIDVVVNNAGIGLFGRTR
jgi:NAD(P)-dependent dehydrogenase (short-subunit alcohol dehydrogenase family)